MILVFEALPYHWAIKSVNPDGGLMLDGHTPRIVY